MAVGPRPTPVAAWPEITFDEVTKGYVPKSISNSAPWAPSNKILFPYFLFSCKTFHTGAA